jgi:hypothetical protein
MQGSDGRGNIWGETRRHVVNKPLMKKRAISVDAKDLREAAVLAPDAKARLVPLHEVAWPVFGRVPTAELGPPKARESGSGLCGKAVLIA